MKDGNDKFWEDLSVTLSTSDEYLDEEVDDDYYPDLDFDEEELQENFDTQKYEKILEEEESE